MIAAGMESASVFDFFSPDTTGSASPRPAFDSKVVDFLADLSKELLSDVRTREYPDVATFAFWCRRASLERYRRTGRWERALGRGLVFHVAPSNVPVNFAYSLAAGLLAGNANIVRVPSAEFEQVDLILSCLHELVETRHGGIRGYLAFVRYSRSDTERTRMYSERCDVRVIWGGDETVRAIRSLPLSPRAFDVTFPDRYSIAVIDAAEYLLKADVAEVARGFYNDTYLLDQNACTAPHLVVWRGGADTVAPARETFWGSLHALVRAEYELPAVAAVDKLTAAYLIAATHEGSRITPRADNSLVTVELNALPSDVEDFRAACGYFLETRIDSLQELAAAVTGRFQTLAYFGVDQQELLDTVLGHGLSGIDRIVPVGSTLDFDLLWDGYDLISTLTRQIFVR